jgi:hypothetical protein
MKIVTLALVACAMLLAAGAPQTQQSSDDLDGDASAGVALAPPNEAVQAAFAARSYEAGETALLTLRRPVPGLRLRILRAGAGQSGPLEGAAVTGWSSLPHDSRTRVQIGNWTSGLYYAEVVTPRKGSWYAPFVVRPSKPGRSRVLVVLPTNTWQAYNFEDGDSWYFDSSVRTVDLARPYLDGGVPPHYHGYDRGFIRWLALHQEQPDVISDDDLDRRASAATLARAYDLIVFPGHEEYVTAHEYDLIEAFRDLGGNLAFLSANDFFYKVVKNGETMEGRWRWRDLGRPEAALVGEQYIDWNHGEYPNRPFTVTDTSGARWLFTRTGLTDGARFGVYGIEVDAVTPESPTGTRVLAEIHDIFGPGETAEMTYYKTQRGAKVFSAGVMNFGGSSLWPIVSQMVDNLWAELTRP